MAIYHYSIQIIGRSQGRSAVAAAAYRSGEKLVDERTGEIKHYQRDVQPETMILAPEHAPEWVHDRERLWNEVEAAEKRKDSQLAREINVALPVELSHEQQRELVTGYAQEQFVNRGMIADIAIHRDDANNPHAHIMLTMRDITKEGFGMKNTAWNPDFAKKKEQDVERKWLNEKENGFVKNSEKCVDWRKEWAEHTNRALEKANVSERITHLSHEARGLEALPTVHLGHAANAMEKQGIQTDRGDTNRVVQEHNAVVKDLQQYREQKVEREQWKHFSPKEKAAVKEAAALMKTRVDIEKIDKRLESLERWQQKTGKAESQLEKIRSAYTDAQHHFDMIANSKAAIERAKIRLDEVSGFNRLKFWKSGEREEIKQQVSREIQYHEKQIDYHDKRLNYQRKVLGFDTKEQFYEKLSGAESQRLEQSQKINQDRATIQEQMRTLQEARTALQNAEIRRIAAQYPNWEAAKTLTYDGAKALEALNNRAGKVVSVPSVRTTHKHYSEKLSEIKSQIGTIEQEEKRLEIAGKHLADYEKSVAEIERMDKPHNKAKRIFSKELKADYERAVNRMETAKTQMNQCGVESRQDYARQVQAHQARLPVQSALKTEASTLLPKLDLVSNAMKAIQQAARELENQKRKEQWRRIEQSSQTRQRGR